MPGLLFFLLLLPGLCKAQWSDVIGNFHLLLLGNIKLKYTHDEQQ